MSAGQTGQLLRHIGVKKWPDFNRNLVNEKVCLAYTKVNTAAQLGVIGGKADIVTLCFKDGILTDRTSN